MKTNNWFSIKALAETEDSPVEAFIYDEIGLWGITARDFIAAVQPYKARAITLRINSRGGSVFDGLAIYNYLRGLNVTTQIDGIAASMASIVALAGKTVRIARNGFIMVHNPEGGVTGDASQVASYAEFLEKVQSMLSTEYQKETGASAKTVEQWMDGETWFTATEAKEAGLIDEITDAISFSASIRGFSKAPNALHGVDSSTNDDAKNANRNQTMTAADNPQKTFIESLKSLLGLSASEPEPAPQAKVDPPELVQVRADLATARQTIGSLETRIVALEGDVKAAKAETKTEVEKAKAEVDKIAAHKAIEIAASQGIPPVNIRPNETPAKPSVTNNLTGLERAIAAHQAGYESKAK